MQDKEYHVHVDTKNHQDAKEFCINLGGNLFEPKSSQINNEVFDFGLNKVFLPNM